MFKKYKINKLLIKIAGLSAEVETLERIMKWAGENGVSSYYIDKLIEAHGKLAAAKEELELLS